MEQSFNNLPRKLFESFWIFNQSREKLEQLNENENFLPHGKFLFSVGVCTGMTLIIILYVCMDVCDKVLCLKSH